MKGVKKPFIVHNGNRNNPTLHELEHNKIGVYTNGVIRLLV